MTNKIEANEPYNQEAADELARRAIVQYEVPAHTALGLVAYIVNRTPTGDFLRAVLENNLMEAFGRADRLNTFCMKGIVSFIYNEAPIASHGSPEKVKKYLAERPSPAVKP